MRALMALCAALALAACDSRTAKDGYVFGEPEFEREHLTVTIEQYDSPHAFRAAMEWYGIDEPDSVAAFSTYKRYEPSCTIHIMRIKDHYEPEWLGHEMAHCIYGRWHP